MGKKIAFHSYKGGAGRSTGLVNVAYLLAERGHTVGCIDLDIEAAGLKTIFSPPPKARRRNGGVQEYLGELQRGHDVDIGEYVVNFDQMRQFRDDFPFSVDAIDRNGGELNLMLAEVSADELGEVPSEMEMISIFGEVFDEFEASYDLDYLLLDGRSGIGGFAIPALVHSDAVAEFFRWSEQHKRGIEEAVEWLDSYLRALGSESVIYPVASSVPLEDPNLEETRENVAAWIEEESGNGETPVMGWSHVADRYVIIPESSHLKVKEQMIVSPDNPNGRDPVVEAYHELADALE